MTSAHEKELIEAPSDLVVHLPAQGYGTTGFEMGEARRSARRERAQGEATRIARSIPGD